MAPRGWAAITTRKSFLDDRGPQYQLAVDGNTKTAFFEKLYHDYFNIYHWSLKDTDEPVPGAVYAEPITNDAIAEKETIISKKKQVCVVYTSTQNN
jgi:hypothetical protein